MDYISTNNGVPSVSHFSIAMFFAVGFGVARFFLDRHVFRVSFLFYSKLDKLILWYVDLHRCDLQNWHLLINLVIIFHGDFYSVLCVVSYPEWKLESSFSDLNWKYSCNIYIYVRYIFPLCYISADIVDQSIRARVWMVLFVLDE